MTTTQWRDKKRRVQCAGCSRRMYELAPGNRDWRNRSWHHDCLVAAIAKSTGK